MESQKKDIFVGIFVVVAISLLAAIIIIKQGFSFGRYPIRVTFGAITNISEGTKVRLKGYEIGQVERIDFFYEPKDPHLYGLDVEAYKEGVYFIVALTIKEEYRLHKGVKAKIKSSGVVGDNFIDLDVSQQEATILTPGAVIPGEDVFDMSIFLVKTREMIESVTGMATGIHTMAQNIKEAEFGEKIGRFVELIHKISYDFKHLTLNIQPVLDNANAVVIDARPKINEAITQLNNNLTEAQKMIADMRTMIQDNNASMKRSMETLERNLSQLNDIIVKIDSMTTENQDEINAVLRNLLDASASFKDLAEHPWKIISGRKKQQK